MKESKEKMMMKKDMPKKKKEKMSKMKDSMDKGPKKNPYKK